MWWERNKFVHNRIWKKPKAVIEDARSILYEYHRTHNIANHSEHPTPKFPSKWERPPENTLKLNVDATCSEHSGLIGIGGIICDHNGSYEAVFSQKLKGFFDPLVAELLVIRASLMFAKEVGPHIDITESECSTAMTVTNNLSGHSPLYLIVNDIVSLLKEAGGGICRFSPLTENETAHLLAKLALSCNSEGSWIQENPGCVATIVANDST
ncbi:Ribonuclease H-like domain containing protein [Parasponia andersonii]|uniref:Ribonuclease H-like domain containing protein n=1 Tax=Parasponia andersonii TaxID=3476 RepID=A0A2P5A8E9_PARAD|nr:Ribonuclease H-like domain containing protein [Parasponia andersonii]